jgi:dephospho-CoA kinase
MTIEPAPPTSARSTATTYRVGLTGGIASGKSTVAAAFAALGVPVIDADVIARDVVARGSALLDAVVQRFGAALRRADGSLDRAALRRIVFADSTARHDLEVLLHPAIRALTARRAAAADGPYQIHMMPLLVETQAMSRYNRIAVVDCAESQQLARLMTRDGLSTAEAEAMLASQVPRSARLAVADDIIDNSGESAHLHQQVAKLHDKYLTLAQAARSHVNWLSTRYRLPVGLRMPRPSSTIPPMVEPESQQAAHEASMFEQPLNERMRTFLRLDFLYSQALYHNEKASPVGQLAPRVDSLLDILAILTRGDVPAATCSRSSSAI